MDVRFWKLDISLILKTKIFTQTCCIGSFLDCGKYKGDEIPFTIEERGFELWQKRDVIQ